MKELTREYPAAKGGPAGTACLEEVGPTGAEEQVRQLASRVSDLVRIDARQALQEAEAALDAAKGTEDRRTKGLAAKAKAQALHFLSRFEEALSHYDQAISIYSVRKDALEIAKVQVGRIDALVHLGQYEEALTAAHWARRVFMRHGAADLTARLDVNVGNIYHRLDQHRKALGCYRRAGDAAEACGDWQYKTIAEINQANALTQLDQFEAAVELFESARATCEKHGLRQLGAHVDFNLAYAKFSRCECREALDLLVGARETFAELGDRSFMASCDLNRSEIYLQMGMYREAASLSESALKAFTRLRMRYDAAIALTNIAAAHFYMGDQETARRGLRRARLGFKREGNQVWESIVDLYLAEVLLSEGRAAASCRLSRKAREIFVREGLAAKEALAVLQMARSYHQMGRSQDAEDMCVLCRTIIREHGLSQLSYMCHRAMGNILETGGDLSGARKHYALSLDQIERLQQHIPAAEFRISFAEDKSGIYQDAVRVSLLLGDESDHRDAFKRVEQAKSRSLVDYLGKASAAPIPPAETDHDEDKMHAMRRVCEELNWYYRRLNEAETSSSSEGRETQASRAAPIRSRIRHRQAQLSRMLDDLALHNREYASLHRVSVVPLEELQAELDEDEVLLEYYFVEDNGVIFVVTRDGLRVFPNAFRLGQVEELFARLQLQLGKFSFGSSYTESHRREMVATTDEHLGELYELLLEKVAPLFEGRRLTIVPHGILHKIPFHALKGPAGYLTELCKVAYCPSATVLRFCKQKRFTSSGRAVLLGASEDHSPDVEREIKLVSDLLPESEVLTGPNATREKFLNAVPGCQYVHIATHSVFYDDLPLLSSMRLHDSWMSVYDVYSMRLDAELVTLSTCRSGVAKIGGGDDLLGFVRGFLYAGAPAVIAALWSVDDQSAPMLMEVFYRELGSGATKAEALQRAQHTVREKFEHPYYWAPFVLIGRDD